VAKAEKAFANMLRLAINEAHSEGGTRLRMVADALVTKAMAGDVPAIKEIAERLDGKVPQAVVGDNEHDPINMVTKIVREIVRPNTQDSDR
jgi:hypothetical protein